MVEKKSEASPEHVAGLELAIRELERLGYDGETDVQYRLAELLDEAKRD